MKCKYEITKKQAVRAFYILILIILFICSGCSSSNPIVYTPTPEPEITPEATEQLGTDSSNALEDNTGLFITEDKEYNYDYTAPSLIGNTGANINNGGLCVYDDNRVYYIDQGIYSMTTDGLDVVHILDMQNISCLNSVGDYLYFLSNHDGGIYRVKKQENVSAEYLLIDGAKSLIVIGDSMYYTCAYSESNNCMVYRTQVGGTNQVCLFFNANNLYPDNNYIYFDNADDENKLYRYDTISGEIVKLTDDKASDINIADDQIYYISENTSYNVVRMDRNGENTMVVVSEPCNTLNFKGDNLIYTSVKTGYIYSYSIATGEKQTLLEYDSIDSLCVARNIIFFETVIVKGEEPSVYYLNLKNNEVNDSLPVKYQGYIKWINATSKTMKISLVHVYEEQEAIEMYAKNNNIPIEEAREELYNEQGIYYIDVLSRDSLRFKYLDWTNVTQKRRATSLNISTPYVSDIASIASMYDDNPQLLDKLVYEFTILDDEILDIEEIFYPIDFYS